MHLITSNGVRYCVIPHQYSSTFTNNTLVLRVHFSLFPKITPLRRPDRDMATRSQRSPHPEVQCRHCGHSGHRMSKCPSITCFKCQGKGHMASGCPNKDPCERCFRTNHTTGRCPYNTPEYSDVTFIPVPSNTRKRVAEDPPAESLMSKSREQVYSFTNHDASLSF